MGSNAIAIVILIVTSLILFSIGFFCVFFSKKITEWHVYLLNALKKRRLAISYNYTIRVTKEKWYKIYLKTAGIIVILMAILIFSLAIYRYRHPYIN